VKVLVTGGAGFIGSHVVDHLVAAGHEPVIVDNLSSGDVRSLRAGVKFHELSLNDPALGKVFEGPRIDAICNLAAKTNMRESLADPFSDIETNILGFVRLLELAIKHRVKRFVQSSTGGALYGNTTLLPVTEEAEPWPISPYGVAKLAAEKYLSYYHAVHNLSVVILRYSNVFGPRNERKKHIGSVTTFIQKVLVGGEIAVNGDGQQTRDFIYVEDLARINLAALAREKRDYLVCNASGGGETSVLDIIRIIERLSGRPARITHRPAISGEVLRSALSNARARQELGWEPLFSIEEGVKRTLEHLARNAPERAPAAKTA
jgi:UDP-glucose 4-epimerase